MRVAGERRDNLEQTIDCYREAMRVWTLDAFPISMQRRKIIWVKPINIAWQGSDATTGAGYSLLSRGDACLDSDGLPQDYAMAQRNLGVTYQVRWRGNASRTSISR